MLQTVIIYENQKRVSALGPFTEKEAQGLVEQFTKQLAAKDIELVQHEKTSPLDLRDKDGLAETFLFADDNENTFQVNLVNTGYLVH